MSTAKKLAGSHEDQSFAKGEVLMKEGDASGDLWILRQGEVEIYRERGGHRHVLAKVGPGEMLGTMTATTGAKRSASAIALTDVKVTVVSKDQVQKLIKDLPTWAHAFIKDLVARVNYANELYIDHELEHASGSSPFELVLKLVRTLPALAESHAKPQGGRRVVALKPCSKALAQVLGDEAQVKHVLQLFSVHGLLSGTGEGDQAVAPIEQIHELSLLAGIFEAVSKAQVAGQPFQLPLALGERKCLAEIAKLGGGSGDRVLMSLADVEDSLRKVGIELDVEALTRARRLGLLELDKAAKPPSVTFDPRWIQLALQAFGMMRELATGAKDEGAANRDKKTLLY